jgi:hypothetical protein
MFQAPKIRSIPQVYLCSAKIRSLRNCPYRKSHLAANKAGTGCTFRRELGTIPAPTAEACPVASLH